MKEVSFINLTNGLESLIEHNLDFDKCRFIRIQSTACEQKRWATIIDDLSPDFMLHAAIGSHIYIYDYGANKEIPRAIWQGIEWIKYVLQKRWHSIDYSPVGRAISMQCYFEKEYAKLPKTTKAKLDYYKKYVGDRIYITSFTNSTEHDGDYSFYNNLVEMYSVM